MSAGLRPELGDQSGHVTHEAYRERNPKQYHDHHPSIHASLKVLVRNRATHPEQQQIRFLVVHDQIGNLALKLSQIPYCGYLLLGRFTISERIWWRDYYEPFEQRIQQLRAEHRDDPDVLYSLAKEQREVDMFKKEPRRFASVFFVMEKIPSC